MGDWLSCKWLQARDDKNLKRTTYLSMIIESLNWIPFWFLIKYEDPYIAIIYIVGSGVGTFNALKKDFKN